MPDIKELLTENRLLKERLAAEHSIFTSFTAKTEFISILELIVQQARNVTHAIAGSIYLRVMENEEERLRFLVSQNDRVKGYDYKTHTLPINTESIAGYVASTKKTLNIPDVREIPSSEDYSFNNSFDREVQALGNDFETISMITAPLLDNEDNLVGVIQLIDSLEKGDIVPFNKANEANLEYYSRVAAIGIINKQLYDEKQKAFLGFANSLATAIEARDSYTGGHTRRVVTYSLEIGKYLELTKDEEINLEIAAILHDIGKIGINDSILNKDGKLTEGEFEKIKTHPEIGEKIIHEVPQLRGVIPGILYHHERVDGNGYPYGLLEASIPLSAAIIQVADTYDAITTKRSYKSALSKEEAAREIKKNAGKQFDRRVVNAFLKAYEKGELEVV